VTCPIDVQSLPLSFAAADERGTHCRAHAELHAELEWARAELAEEIERRTRAEQLCGELGRRSLQAREDEQRRIARDLHDQVGQTLTALKLAITASRQAIVQTDVALARINDAEQACAELERGLAEVAERLRPSALDALGLRAALEQHLATWTERTRIEVGFECPGLSHKRLPEEVETALYRLVQEALTNVARHAEATQVDVVVQLTDEYALISVEDDGVGFEPDAIPEGSFGLVGMHERVTLCGGSLEIQSSPGRGTAILSRVPLGGPGSQA